MRVGRIVAATLAAGIMIPASASARCTTATCQIYSTEAGVSIFPVDLTTFPFSRVGEQFRYTTANLYQASNGGVVAYSSPFSLNVGYGSTTSLFIKEDGVVSIGQALPGGSFAQTSSLSSLGVPLIAPFYADLNQNSRTAIGAGYAGIIIQQGLADPFADATGAYSAAEAKTALRITWYGFDVATPGGSTAPVWTQLLLVDEGNGDFDFKIRAGEPGTGAANSPGGGIGGFVFARDSYQYATPYTSASSGAFSVRGGEIALLTPPVPEPGAWGLMFAGIGAAGAVLRRRRKSPGGRRVPAGQPG